MRSLPGWVFILGTAGFVLLTALCSVVAFVSARQFSVQFHSIFEPQVEFAVTARTQPPNTRIPTTAPVTATTPTVTAAPRETGSPEPLPPADTTVTADPLGGIEAITDPRRITILVMGIDQRTAVDTDRAYRTDTMILVNIDPVGKRVGMLWLPRDLWVPIPGYQTSRINQANYFGDLDELPGGGPALAARSVEGVVGIPVNYYIRVNFDVFLRIVDLLAPNGIEVCPTEAIDDPKYPDAGYGTLTIHFDPGCQRLNAERLLQYMRTRATLGGDFDRARRQQEVLLSMQREFLSVGGITNFITQAPAVWEEVSENVVTNLAFDQILQLAVLASQINTEDITTGAIDNAYVDMAVTSSNDQILIPRYHTFGSLLEQVFNPRPNLTIADLRVEADREDAAIVVFNNTTISGLAAQTRDWLASRQVTVQEIGSIEVPTGTDTVIRDYTGNPWTTRYLAELLGLPENRIVSGSDGLTSADIMIVVGSDLQPLLSGTPTP